MQSNCRMKQPAVSHSKARAIATEEIRRELLGRDSVEQDPEENELFGLPMVQRVSATIINC
ncbi:MAG: hypothetical protein ACM3KM_00590 [Acidobacteriaceae bacterium]